MSKDKNQSKQRAAEAALDYISPGCVLGVGTGSTVEYFIDALVAVKSKISATVASSERTARLLQQHAIPVVDLNTVMSIDLYVDGADEMNTFLTLIKGGGGALTREKIIAAVSKQFLCIVDGSKQVRRLGAFPLPIEVIPMARSYVAREMIKLGGVPEYREGFVTDNGNIILDVRRLDLSEPIAMERQINGIVGVVASGLFAERGADMALVASKKEVELICR